MDNVFAKLRDLFVVNLPLKIGAVLIAVFIWFIILNFNDPVRTQEIRVPLQVWGEVALTSGVNQFFLENGEDLRGMEVVVQVRGSGAGVAVLEANLQAYIDLSTADIVHAAMDTSRLPVRVNVAGNFGEGVDFRSHSPSSVTLHLDNIVDREFDIDLNITGQAADGYVRVDGRATLNPRSVFVRGPRTLLDQVGGLSINWDVDGASDHTFNLNTPVTILGLDGEVFENEHLRPHTGVTLNIPIYRGGTAHILPVTHEGDIAPGFGIQPIHITPAQFDVAGTREAIASLVPITLPPIALNGRADSFNVNFDVRQHLPPGVFLVGDTHTATAQIFIEPIGQRHFTVGSDSVNFVGATNFQVLTDSVTFTVSAMESILAEIDAVSTSISLFGRGDGEHTINLNVHLPPGATVIGATPTMTVRIGDGQNEEEYPQDEEQDLEPESYPTEEDEEGTPEPIEGDEEAEEAEDIG